MIEVDVSEYLHAAVFVQPSVMMVSNRVADSWRS